MKWLEGRKVPPAKAERIQTTTCVADAVDDAIRKADIKKEGKSPPEEPEDPSRIGLEYSFHDETSGEVSLVKVRLS